MDLHRPFRHDRVIASGTLARHQLTDGSFQPLFGGVSVRAGVTVTMALRAAGAVLAYPDAVVAGLAAAALWGVDVAPADTTVDLVIGPSGRRGRPGVRLHRGTVAPTEVATVAGVRVTSPARTAVDLARWLPKDRAVVVLDALLGQGPTLEAVREVAAALGEGRDRAAVEPVLAWVDPRSPSPGASRLRVGLLARGMEVPLVAQRLGGEGRLVAELALAWPGVRLGVAHGGGAREAAAAVGWEVVEVREGLAEEWGTRTAPAPIDALATVLRRAGERWDPVPRVGGRNPARLPGPPGPDGECDGGLSRLVPT